MVYANVVIGPRHRGLSPAAAEAGAAGLIVPDLPHDEAPELRDACDAAGLALVPLVAPSTTGERRPPIGAVARGFVYTVSLAGTTGERAELPAGAAGMVERVRGRRRPVAVGFGVSTRTRRAPSRSSRTGSSSAAA